jgi:glucosamine--fructose-6-phosphate aminotransferase (isomerizing)
MCGIIGIVGSHQATPIMVDALRRLEYRGYDSAGVATVGEDGAMDRRRAVGKLRELDDALVLDPLPGRAGIGHTRWATHGAPTRANAHPHVAGPVAVVHNGIVENFRALREELTAEGANLESETDTEVIAVLAARGMAAGMDPVTAAFAAVDRLTGAFALAFLFEGEPDLIVAARAGSPLAIGHGEGETFLGSDAIALAPLTTRLTYLEEGDRAVLRRAGVEIFAADGARAERPITHVRAGEAAVDKAGHRHFMAKEIAEQPAVLADALAAYLKGDGIALPEGLDLAGARRVVIVACGTAYLAGLTAKYWIEARARIPVDVEVASEFRYREPPVGEGTLALLISQSGETADTLAALRYLKGRAACVAGVVNVETSTIAREADVVLPIRAGVEIGVASTKAFTCQLAVLALLSLEMARVRGAEVADDLAAMRSLPGHVAAAIAACEPLEAIAAEIAEARDVLFLGRGPMYPLALEGALKLKEISYIHAEGYASGELKHGPIALVDAHVPVVVMAPSGPLFDKGVSNMQEVMARAGKVLLISDEAGLAEAGAGTWARLAMPSAPEALTPITYAVPAQLLAYHAAVAMGTDVDQPRNLAKSVTVE